MVFEGPGGASIHTYGLELDFWLSVWIGYFRAAVRLLDEEDYLKFGRKVLIIRKAFIEFLKKEDGAMWDNVRDKPLEASNYDRRPRTGRRFY